MSRKINTFVSNDAIFEDPLYVRHRPKSGYNRPHPKMQVHINNMEFAPSAPRLSVKSQKGAIKLTNKPLNTRNKRIRPDVVNVLDKHTASRVASSLKGLPKQEARGVRRLLKQRKFKQACKQLGVAVNRKSIVKRVRRPADYNFAIELRGK